MVGTAIFWSNLAWTNEQHELAITERRTAKSHHEGMHNIQDAGKGKIYFTFVPFLLFV
jgi:hypothetical protein